METQWNLQDIYASDATWQEDIEECSASVNKLVALKGTLASDACLKDALLLYAEISERLEKIYAYAHMRYDLDHSDAAAQALNDKALHTYHTVSEATAFLVPEMMTLPTEQLDGLLQKYDELQPFSHMLKDLQRGRAYVLPAEQEALVSMAAPALSTMDTAFSLLDSTEIPKGSIVDENGETVELTGGMLMKYRISPNRTVREQAFRVFHQAYANFGNTIAALYAGQIRADIFAARSHKYSSCLNKALFADNLPESLYDGLIEAVHAYLPAHHRYLELRRKALGVDVLHLYDCYVPLVQDTAQKEYTYTQAVEMVTEYLKPLGDTYIADLKRLFQGGWVDVYEKEGKETGAYATSVYGIHPYMLLNFMGTLTDVFTVAHEAGHCMHSYYSDQRPYMEKDYPIFLAEIASTVNENLLLDGMLSHAKTPAEKAFLINHWIDEMRGTVIRQTMFAEFEKKVHALAEQGEPLTADLFCKVYHDLLVLYFGDKVEIDPYMDWEWARIPHFYRAFYVFKYATGFSAAAALCQKLEREKDPTSYLTFLHAGGSDYPLEILKRAGVDLSEPTAIKSVLELFSDRVNILKELLEDL